MMQVTAGCGGGELPPAGPARDAEFRRPRGQRLAVHPLEQSAVLEGPIDQDRHAAFGRERQQALLGVRVTGE
jgi:hypothetical protein